MIVPFTAQALAKHLYLAAWVEMGWTVPPESWNKITQDKRAPYLKQAALFIEFLRLHESS